MRIEILQATPNPIEVISLAAGCCYGKDDVSEKRVERCVRSGHHSVLEHACVTFEVEGISRACSHQLVRHRLASFSQQSQRYCRIDVDSDDWYVVPPSIAASHQGRYGAMMRSRAADYKLMLESGYRPEDARYLLPEACKTTITVSMNARELFHFLDVRTGKGAQWEIRGLAGELERAVAGANDQWAALLKMREQ